MGLALLLGRQRRTDPDAARHRDVAGPGEALAGHQMGAGAGRVNRRRIGHQPVHAGDALDQGPILTDRPVVSAMSLRFWPAATRLL